MDCILGVSEERELWVKNLYFHRLTTLEVLQTAQASKHPPQLLTAGLMSDLRALDLVNFGWGG